MVRSFAAVSAGLSLVAGASKLKIEPGQYAFIAPGSSLGLRHCDYQAYACPFTVGNQDFLFNVVAPLSAQPGGLSLQSTNYPADYVTVVGTANGAVEATRLGIGANPVAEDGTFVAVPGLADPSMVSLQVLSGSFAGSYVARNDGTLSGTCASNYGSPSSDVYLSDGSDKAAATWQAVSFSADPVTNYTLGGLTFGLRNLTGTVTMLHDAGDTSGFDFLPLDGKRIGAGFHHFGDVTLKVRPGGGQLPYTTISSADVVGLAPQVQPLTSGAFWASDISSLIATPVANGLTVTREYSVAKDGQGVVMSIVMVNSGADAIDVGGVGVSIITNNNWNGLTLEQNAATCSLLEPYIGGDAGFAKATRITGSGPVLMVAPHYPSLATGCADVSGTTPFGPLQVVHCGAPLQAWRALREDATGGLGVSFEGFYQYTAVTGGWVENEWAGALGEQWTEPNYLLLQPGQAAVFPFRVWTQPAGQEGTEAALVAAGLPLARGLPGYILPQDVTSAQLLVAPPAGGSIAGIDVHPAGSLTIGNPIKVGDGYISYPLTPASGDAATGRVRLTITHKLSSTTSVKQVVNYLLTPPSSSLLASYSSFTANRAWYNDTTDPFGRAYSVLGWDGTGGPNAAGAQLIQEERVFAAGLSDEAGAGANLGYALHASYAGFDIAAAASMATYANRTLAGQKADGMGLQVSVQDPSTSGIRASMFWGTIADKMPNFNYSVCMDATTPWYCWDEPRGETQWRSYNYVHQVRLGG